MPETNTAENPYQAPKGVCRRRQWNQLDLEVTADWIVLRKKEKPAAEIFYTAYRLPDTAARPVTFVFNGGPGAASAFLHLGSLGPDRVYFEADGTIAPSPVRLVKNEESWVDFTDLVFIDPVGTGFSRVIESEGKPSTDKKDPNHVDEKEFYQINRDLDSICEFIERYLSANKLWDRPIYLAGESYGGFRTAKLARLLQEKTGVALCGVIIISPAMEWGQFDEGDYNVLRSVDTFCGMALAAVYHGKSRIFSRSTPVEEMRTQIEAYATRELAHALLVGASDPDFTKVYQSVSDYLGLPLDYVQIAQGRVPADRFCRDLLKDQRLVLGRYDTTVTAIDPYPDRERYQAPDPTLINDQRVFTSGANHLLRGVLGLDTDRRYELLSFEINEIWKRDDKSHVFDNSIGATDDLRYAMSMNQHMKVLITHGYYDLVTPYFTSERLVNQMKLPEELRHNLHIRHFVGGHMFYTWENSRREFRNWVRSNYIASNIG